MARPLPVAMTVVPSTPTPSVESSPPQLACAPLKRGESTTAAFGDGGRSSFVSKSLASRHDAVISARSAS